MADQFKIIEFKRKDGSVGRIKRPIKTPAAPAAPAVAVPVAPSPAPVADESGSGAGWIVGAVVLGVGAVVAAVLMRRGDA